MSSTDSSVDQLVNRLQEFEGRRRRVMMHSKESENKLGFATEQQLRSKQDLLRLGEQELSLKQQLQSLMEEQRQILLVGEKNHLSVETAHREEPLLMKAAEKELQGEELKFASWQKKLEDVRIAATIWNGDNAAASSIHALIASEQREYEALLEAERNLLVQGAQVASKPTLPPSNTDLSVTSVETTAQQQQHLSSAITAEAIAILKDHLDNESIALQNAEAVAARQTALASKEVKELSSRHAELSTMLQDASASCVSLGAAIVELDSALSSKRCKECQ